MGSRGWHAAGAGGAWVIVLCLAVSAGGCGDGANAQRSTNADELLQLCVSCHGSDLGGRREVNAPAIAGLSQGYVERQLHKFRQGLRGGHFDDIAGFQMRPMAVSLTEQDVVTIAARVSAMPAVVHAPTIEGGRAEQGKILFAACAACHGQHGEGNEPVKAPALNRSSDWYLLTQLRHFQSGVRGASAADAEGATMAPMAKTLADEQAIKDVLAYVATLK